MASRVGPVVVLVLLACGMAAGSAVARQPPVGAAMYVVRQDQRLCPSPRCGGYWVTIANGARTRCTDRLRHLRCYVATAVGRMGDPLGRLAEGGLVQGAMDAWRDDLGRLVVSAQYAPSGTASESGGFYRVMDRGIRCVRAPCFSFRVTQVNGSTRTMVSGVDLGAAEALPRDVARAQTELSTQDGLYARGRFARSPDGGTVFRALRLYLRAPLPRA